MLRFILPLLVRAVADHSGAWPDEVICNEGSLMNTKTLPEVVRIVPRKVGEK